MRCGIIAALLVISISSPAFAIDWMDWFKHWNMSFEMATGSPYTYGEQHQATITIQDEFGDTYSFDLVQAGLDGTLDVQRVLGFRIPFYYTDEMSIGIYGSAKEATNVLTAGMSGISGMLAGVYIRHIYGPISLHGVVGASSWSAFGDLGELKPAWPGDPGAYINGKFYEPGTRMRFSASSESQAWGVGVRYSILPVVYLEAMYQAWGPAEIVFTEYKLDDLTIHTSEEGLPKPVSIDAHSTVNVGVGIGF